MIDEIALESAAKANVRFKSQSFSIITVELVSTETNEIISQIEKKLIQAPLFFQYSPLVIDLDRIRCLPGIPNYILLKEVLAEKFIYLQGVTGGNKAQQISAQKASLPVLNYVKKKNITEKNTIDWLNIENFNKKSSIIINGNVRSGQQRVSRYGDLIIIGSVNPGAEVLANGNIHIYGSLSGRALAGIVGDETARIFCNKLEAELVSIAGNFKTYEELYQDGLPEKAVSIFVENKNLSIDIL